MIFFKIMLAILIFLRHFANKSYREEGRLRGCVIICGDFNSTWDKTQRAQKESSHYAASS